MTGPKNLCVLLSEKESNATKNNAPFRRVVFCFFKENQLLKRSAFSTRCRLSLRPTEEWSV